MFSGTATESQQLLNRSKDYGSKRLENKHNFSHYYNCWVLQAIVEWERDLSYVALCYNINNTPCRPVAK
jgi:hypothetical protein